VIGPAYVYKAEVTAVHDGDTITADVDLGFDVWMRNQSIRLFGINAPELKLKTAKVDIALDPVGIASRDALVNLLTREPTTQRVTFGLPTIIFSKPTPLIMETQRDRSEKYGRWLARLWFANAAGVQVDVNQWMVDQGFAVAYLT
jgi:micrococcal nuclease